MKGTFVAHGNEPLSVIQTRNPEWFGKELTRRGVSALEIARGDYKAQFHEVPEHLMDAYLLLRPKLFHRVALEEVLKQR